MKNDVNKVEKITFEMEINDIEYCLMQDEYDDLSDDIDYGDYDDFEEEMDRAYFYKRVLSLLANEDVPPRAAVGLYSKDGILNELYSNRETYIGESDTDEDIYKYVIEYGYRRYDQIAHLGKTPEDVFNALVRKCIYEFMKGAYEDYDE